jgi:3-deoxy-manno-octulosonate cytidylyltransferase (CMP-KDO synthetase)
VLTATVVIPARYASTRFPGKIVAAATGKPLVQHVVDQVRKCKRVRRILVAADDPRIARALAPYGTDVVMTAPDHPSGTDRIAEVARQLDDSVIVNVQGDEPEIEPDIVDGLIGLIDEKTPMATAAAPLASAEVKNPNLVKVVLGRMDQALYFSRSPIPYYRDSAGLAAPTYWLHLGIYAYQRSFLLEYAGWAPTPLEQAEKLEQLRVLEHGRTLRVLKVDRASHGIDTPEQYNAFLQRFNEQRITP